MKKFDSASINEARSEKKVIYLDKYNANRLLLQARQIMDMMQTILTTRIVPLYLRNLLIKHRISIYNMYFRKSILAAGRNSFGTLPQAG